MEKSYSPADIEARWYKHWEESGYFAPDGDGEPDDPTETTLPQDPELQVEKVDALDLGSDGILNVGDAIDYTLGFYNASGAATGADTVGRLPVPAGSGVLTMLGRSRS